MCSLKKEWNLNIGDSLVGIPDSPENKDIATYDSSQRNKEDKAEQEHCVGTD